MKKNNKGFFLAETIIVISLVTTIMAFVYPTVLSIYENFENQVKYFDQTEDIYTLRAIYSLDHNDEDSKKIDKLTIDGEDGAAGCKNISDLTLVEDLKNEYKLNGVDNKLYIVNFMYEFNKDDPKVDTNKYPSFDTYLKQLKKNSSDYDSYRLIGIFGDGSDDSPYRYASIKIYNPNPKGYCDR